MSRSLYIYIYISDFSKHSIMLVNLSKKSISLFCPFSVKKGNNIIKGDLRSEKVTKGQNDPFKHFLIFLYIRCTSILSFIYVVNIFDLLHILIIWALMTGYTHFRKNFYAEPEL